MKKLLGIILVTLLSTALFGAEFRAQFNGRYTRFVEVKNGDYAAALQELNISELNAIKADSVLRQLENCLSAVPEEILSNKAITRSIGPDETYLCIAPSDIYNTTMIVHVLSSVGYRLTYTNTKAQGSMLGDIVDSGLDQLNYYWNKGMDWAGNALRNSKARAEERSRQRAIDKEIGLY